MTAYKARHSDILVKIFAEILIEIRGEGCANDYKATSSVILVIFFAEILIELRGKMCANKTIFGKKGLFGEKFRENIFRLLK